MTAPTITVKRCPQCGETKSVDGFHRNRSNRDGLQSLCKSCRRDGTRAYREAHREEIRAYAESYREAHREEARAYQRAYYDVHREEALAYQRTYGRERYALLGNPTIERWREIAAKHATHRGEPWSEAEDAYLAASTDRVVDDAIAIKRTHESVEIRIARIRKRGVALARDANRR